MKKQIMKEIMLVSVCPLLQWMLLKHVILEKYLHGSQLLLLTTMYNLVVEKLIPGVLDVLKKWITVVREIQKKLKGGQV